MLDGCLDGFYVRFDGVFPKLNVVLKDVKLVTHDELSEESELLPVSIFHTHTHNLVSA